MGKNITANVDIQSLYTNIAIKNVSSNGKSTKKISQKLINYQSLNSIK